MASKKTEMQRILRRYKEETGERQVDMHKLAAYAVKMGWPMPQPQSPIDRLAREFSEAAREEIRHDKKTGKPYRANHALQMRQGDLFYTVWIDIDEAPRPSMWKSLTTRREQMVGDGVQLTLDADHWNSIHPKEEPIVMQMDLTPDVEWRKNAPDEEDEAA